MRVAAANPFRDSDATRTDVTFLPLSKYRDPEAALATVLPLVQEAGNPYFDWFFGSAEWASAALADLMSQDSSEVAACRVKLAVVADEIVGMYIALVGVRVRQCRQADTIALLRSVGRDPATRTALLGKLAISRDLFPPIQPEEFYLSKMGVVPGERRRGLGRAIAAEFVAAGRLAGFRRFRLDVCADNESAVRIYRSLGFAVDSEHEAAGMRYLSMLLRETRRRGSKRGR